MPRKDAMNVLQFREKLAIRKAKRKGYVSEDLEDLRGFPSYFNMFEATKTGRNPHDPNEKINNRLRNVFAV